jgi:serine/threonine-protein kinase
VPILTTEERLGGLLANRYRLESVLGSGGMGVLFRALDETTGDHVAVKMLKPVESMEPDRVARFQRESRILGTLRHPNIALFLDSGVDETGSAYLVMELLEGTSLEQELAARGVLSFAESLAVVVPIASALAVAHARGVVHRDVKPSNIFLCRDANGAVVPKLLDFGIARSHKDEFETRTGVFVGTLGYVAPEQAKDADCGPFTDVWAIGAVLYRSLSGQPPHVGGSVPDVLARLTREPAAPLVVKGVKKSACATIDRALAREPERRYQTMQAFVSALEGELTETSDFPVAGEMPGAGVVTFEAPSSEPELPVRSVPSARRSPLRVALAGFAVIAVVAVAAMWSSERREPAVAAAPSLERDVAPATTASAPLPLPVPAITTDVVEAPRASPSAAVEPAKLAAHRHAATLRPAPLPQASVPAPATSAAPVRETKTGLPVATEW